MYVSLLNQYQQKMDVIIRIK